MMVSRGTLLGLLGVLGGLGACGAEGATGERTGAIGEAVINGEVDANHPMVVAYLHNGSLCSATIVAVKGSTGYALTAAHCIGAEAGEIVVGTDINAPTKKFPVIDRLQHPGYKNTSLFDVAMVKFSGADGTTPIMPVLTPALDDLKSKTTVDVVGYGKTEDSGGQIGVKHHRFQPIKDVTDLRIIYDQAQGGLCSGDSGGPSTYYPSIEYVAGVHSYVSSNNGSCLVEGTDMRVSAFVDTFIQPYIDGKPTKPQTCNQCTEAHTASGLCAKTVETCFAGADKQCPNYQSCMQGCKTNGCIVNCKTKYPNGAKLYGAIFSCICDTGCVTECESASFCNQPKCGLSAAKPTCGACFEASCCAEAQACANSATCIDCVSSIAPGAGCKNDPAKLAYDECLATHCATECNLPSSTSSSSSSGAGGAGGDASSASSGGGGENATAASSGSTGSAPAGDVAVEQGCSVGHVGANRDDLPLAMLALGAVVGARRRRPRA